mgnify:CR=1 FL=1
MNSKGPYKNRARRRPPPPPSPQCGSCDTGSLSAVFGLLDEAARRLTRIHARTVREAGLTPPQYYILTLLWERDGRPLKELASICRCSRATITGVVDTLEKKGLVSRQPNPQDRRSLLARLSKKGAAMKGSAPGVERLFGSCCHGLTAGEFRQLGILLKKLNASLID